MRLLGVIVLLGACTDGSSGSGDVVGPFSGPVHRYAIDSFSLPLVSAEVRNFGDDLDGKGGVDNQLGTAIALEAGEGNITPYGADLIGSGQLASFLEIQTDSLTNDAGAGVRYLGAEGAPSVVMGGRFVGGNFESNRTRDTAVPGAGVVRLPVFIDADVAQLQLNGMQIDLTPDGNGGFDGLVCGGIPGSEALADAARAVIQMTRANPADHPYVIAIYDANKDGQITEDEAIQNSLAQSLLHPDIDVRGVPSVSLGFRFHASACPGDVCPTPPAPTNLCHDRVVDGDEADVDCGGTTCRKCAGGLACRTGADCSSSFCDAGTCREPTCSDGAWDGFESDVDCGWNCARCTAGKHCERAEDCTSGQCSGGTCL